MMELLRSYFKLHGAGTAKANRIRTNKEFTLTENDEAMGGQRATRGQKDKKRLDTIERPNDRKSLRFQLRAS